jgi:hypothetical protein
VQHKSTLVAQALLADNQRLLGSIDALREIHADMKEQQKAANPLEMIHTETRSPTQIDHPFELPPVLHTTNRWTTFFDKLSGFTNHVESIFPIMKPYVELLDNGVEFARQAMSGGVEFTVLGRVFTDVEEADLPDTRPIEHLMAPLCRARPRLFKVSRKEGKMMRELVVSATAIHELVYRFPTVNKILPSDVASVIARMQGLNLTNITYEFQTPEGVGHRVLSNVIHDTTEYFLAWHFHNVESRFQDPWETSVSPCLPPGGSGNGCCRVQSQSQRGWLDSVMSSVKFPWPRLSLANPIYGFAWFMILLSLCVALCKWVLVPWFVEPLFQYVTINMFLTSSALSLSVSVLQCPRWLRNWFGRFARSCVTGCVRTLFRSSREIAQDLKIGCKDWIDQIRIKRE